MSYWALLPALTHAFASVEPAACPSPPPQQPIACKTAILGGGFAGLYAAYTLRSPSVCIFEKNDYWGGRIKDVLLPDTDGVRIGVGGLRVDNDQHDVKQLAADLGIRIAWHSYPKTLGEVRGVLADTPEGTLPAFPTLPADTEEWAMMQQFLAKDGSLDLDNVESTKLPDRAYEIPAMDMYLTDLFAAEGYHFLTDNFRFRNDFLDTDTVSYLQFMLHDIADNSSPSLTGYPIGGMSAFTRGMASAAAAAGVQMFLNDPVLSLEGSSASGGYRVTTAGHVASGAANVLVALDPTAIKHLTGDLAQRIQAPSYVPDAYPIPISVVKMRFSTPWWVKAFKRTQSEVRRIWTTDACLNYVEIAFNEEHSQHNLARVVYADGKCAGYWKRIYDKDTTKGLLTRMVLGQLAKVFQIETVPEPLETYYQYWPNGWYFQHAGAKKDYYQIEEWAKSPLPGENVALANEGWSIYKAWVRAPLRSAMRALEALGLASPTYLQSSPSRWPGLDDVPARSLAKEARAYTNMSKAARTQQRLKEYARMGGRC